MKKIKTIWIAEGWNDVGEYTEKIIRYKDKYGISLNSKNPDLVVTLGGDGSLLDPIYKFPVETMFLPFLKNKTDEKRSIGALVNLNEDQFDEAIKKVLSGEYFIDEAPCAEIQYKDCKLWGFNEVQFEKNNSVNQSGFRGRAFLDGRDIYKYEFYLDGFLFATPKGSGAYSANLHGPVLYDNEKFFVLTPKVGGFPENRYMAKEKSISKKPRSKLIPFDKEVEIEITRGGSMLLNSDTRKDKIVAVYFNDGDKVYFRKSEKTVKVLKVDI